MLREDEFASDGRASALLGVLGEMVTEAPG